MRLSRPEQYLIFNFRIITHLTCMTGIAFNLYDCIRCKFLIQILDKAIGPKRGDFNTVRKHWKVDLVQLLLLNIGVFVVMMASYRSH